MAAPAAEDATGLPGTRTSAVVTENRDVVYTAELQVRVTDVQAAVTRAEVIALTAQGLVAGEETYGSPDEPAAGSSRLVLRVPPVAFRETLGDLRDLGETLSSSQTADDVSAQVTDLDSRIGSQRASVERIRALLGQAQQIADIVAIESELATREAELESLQAQRERLGDLTALSTITVSLVGPTAEQVEQEPDVGFLAGIRSGWEAFGRATAVVLTVAGAVLPFLIAAAVVAAPVAYALRLRRRRTTATQPAAAQHA